MKTKQISKAVKVASAKALSELDYTQRQIAEILQISDRSAWAYIHSKDSEKFRNFSENIKALVLVKEEKVAAKALSKLDEKIPRAQFRDLVGLYKILKELRMPKTQVAVQQNFGKDFKLTEAQLTRIIGD